MAKVYDIKIEDLKDLLGVLKQFAHEPTVQIDIWRLSNYIQKYERNFSQKQASLYDRLIEDSDELHFFKPFYPYSKLFADTGRKQTELSFDTKYSSVLLTDEQVMSDAEEFFKIQGEFFYSQFSDFSSEAEDHLKFISEKADTAGETLTLKSTGEAFVFVPNYSNISKFTILVHEIEHVIDFFSNPGFLDAHVISETAAVFMELLACDFIAKKYNLFDDNFQRRSFLHTIIKSQATLLKDKIYLLDLVNQYKSLKPKALFSKLDEFDFPKKDIEFFLEATIEQDSSYQLPYLIAVELYILYQKNKKLALNILRDIILNGNQYNIFEILNKYGISVNENILLYEDLLYKKITL